jgi:integrase/recombinase XerD
MAERSGSRQDTTSMAHPDLADLAESWLVHLRAERKSPATLRIYRAGVRAYLAWCADNGQPEMLDRNLLAAFTADLLDQGAEPATAQARHLAVRRFSKWLAAEGELPADPLDGMRPPKLDAKLVPVLSDDQLRALLRACEGRTLRDRRDEALVRLLAETGLRAGECVALQLVDVDVLGGTLLVRRGKGGGGRLVPFSPQTARALDRYLRLRRGHPWPTPRPSGWASRAAASATTAFTGPCASGPGRPASRGSRRISFGTRRRVAGWPLAARRAA